MTSGTNSRDLDARAALLHALSTRRAASFEAANSLNRVRQSLSEHGAGLPGADVRQPRPARRWPARCSASSAPRAKTEAVAPGRPARLYWDGSSQSAGRPRRRRDDRAGQPGLSPGSGPRRPSSTGRSTGCSPTASATAGSPHKAKGPGARRPGALLRPGPGCRGPLPPDRHGQRHQGRRARRSNGSTEGQADRRAA